jgi:hypothetical protein
MPKFIVLKAVFGLFLGLRTGTPQPPRQRAAHNDGQDT